MRLRHTELRDRLGQVVADRAFGQVQAPRDVGARQALFGGAQHLPFAIGQRIALAPRILGELRIDDAKALVDAANGIGELFGRRVLQEIAGRAGIEGAPQVAGAGRQLFEVTSVTRKKEPATFLRWA